MNSVTASSVVVGLDQFDKGRGVVEFAAELAGRRQLPLRLVHAFEPAPPAPAPSSGWTSSIDDVLRNSAQHLLDEMVDVLGVTYPDVEVSAVKVQGSPAKVLVEESRRAFTVVLGSRGTGGFADLVIGSTTMHVAAHATCPVIAVPDPAGVDLPSSGVVVGVDGSELSEAAIGYAFDLASDVGDRLTAIQALHDPTRTGVGTMMPIGYDPAEVVEEERLRLAESLAGWQEKFPDVEVDPLVVLGHPVPALVSHATHARILVVGCRGRGALSSLVLGSVSHGVLHHATVPVAVVHRCV